MLKGTMRKILLIRFLEDTLGAEVQQLKIFTSLFLHSPHTDRQEDYGRALGRIFGGQPGDIGRYAIIFFF